MKKTKWLAISLSASMLLAGAAVPAFGATTLTAAQAAEVAKALVPSTSTWIRTENDDGWYEVKYRDESRQETYEIDVSKSTGKAVSFDSSRFDSRGSKTVTLTEAQAQKAVTGEIKDAKILSTVLETDDGYQEYKVNFESESCYGDYTVHPQTGVVLERDIQIGKAPSSTTTAGFLSFEKVTELAQKQVSGGTVTDIDLDYENGTYLYEVELYKDGMEYDIALDAKTGELIWKTSHQDDDSWKYADYSAPSTTSGNKITAEKAREIALAKAPGATITDFGLDHDDGRSVYEGEMRDGRYEYEFKIDASTGSILEWEREYDD